MKEHLEKLNLDRNKDTLSEEEIAFLDTLSDDEVNKLIDECSKQYNYYNAMQQGLKLILNSVYGAFGNEYFVCSTKDIAGGITAMCRDIIKFMDTINETYWFNYWHEDIDLHEHLGITYAKQLDPSYKVRFDVTSSWVDLNEELTDEEIQTGVEEGTIQRKVPVSAYVDTDSLFICFEPGLESCDYKGNSQSFIEKIAKFRLEPMFKKKLDNYAKKYKVKNIQDFELENVNESILFVAKKKYIKHTVWEDGRQYDRLSNIVPKGVDLIKRGTPKFARDKVMDIILYIFDNSTTYNIKDLLKFVRDLKKEFEMTDIDDITQSTNINDYWSTGKIMDEKTMKLIDGPGIVNDKEELIMAKGTYYTRKAAGLYNHLLHKHPELNNTYQRIENGTKVKIYPCVHELNDKFCYIYGSFPKEFAPAVDYDELFEKTVSNSVNEYIDALGLPKLNKRLAVVISLF